jgi:hypothetical protein
MLMLDNCCELKLPMIRKRYAGRLYRERSCCRVQDHFFVRWQSVVLGKRSVKETANDDRLKFLSGVPRLKLLVLRGVAK